MAATMDGALRGVPAEGGAPKTPPLAAAKPREQNGCRVAEPTSCRDFGQGEGFPPPKENQAKRRTHSHFYDIIKEYCYVFILKEYWIKIGS